jgi:hypothetical protein
VHVLAENPYQAPVVNDLLPSAAPKSSGLDLDWNSSNDKLAQPYTRSASKAEPKSLIQGKRTFYRDRPNPTLPAGQSRATGSHLSLPIFPTDRISGRSISMIASKAGRSKYDCR